MPALAPFSGERAVRVFREAGWIQDRQHGSHVILVKPGSSASLSVRLDPEVAPAALRYLMRSAGMTLGDLAELL
jgi:predicted RNA binding protein YcfA (HicA-like mRNA interferase family)